MQENLTVILDLATLEHDAITKALESTNGNRCQAAKLLGIGRTTIYRKMKQYQIEAKPAPQVLPCDPQSIERIHE